MNLRTTHLKDILKFVESNFQEDVDDWDGLRKSILKRKKLLKRVHAKNRPLVPTLPKAVVLPLEGKEEPEETQNEIKKKRNRMSAQISRDRKKEHIKQLERNFQLLQQETLQAKAENEQLKEQLQQLKTPSKNKFLSLLVFLGLIFLISVLKDLFSPQPPPVNIAPIPNSDSKFGLLSAEQQSELVGKGAKVLSELEEDSLMGRPSVRKAVMRKIEALEVGRGEVRVSKHLLGKMEGVEELI